MWLHPSAASILTGASKAEVAEGGAFIIAVMVGGTGESPIRWEHLKASGRLPGGSYCTMNRPKDRREAVKVGRTNTHFNT